MASGSSPRCPSADPKSYLQQLPQAQQDALMGRLLRLRFLPTLEVLLRFYADKGKVRGSAPR